MKNVTQDWLEQLGQELDQTDTPANKRAEIAEERWRSETLDELLANPNAQNASDHLYRQIEKIHFHFLTQEQKDYGWIRSIFYGVYYFRGEFWQIRIPVVMGSPRVNIFNWLVAPKEIKMLISQDTEEMRAFRSVIADSYDYAYAILTSIDYLAPNAFCSQLLVSGDKHLRSMIALLFQEEVNPKAIDEARMAIEIILKAFLAIREGLNDKDLKNQIGHDLEKAFDQSVANGLQELDPLKPKALRLPGVHGRYDVRARTLGELWSTYRLSLAVAATPLRKMIAMAIPRNLRFAAGVGIGVFLTFIGLKNAGFVVADPVTFVKFGEMGWDSVAALVGETDGIIRRLLVRGGRELL